MKTRFKLEKCVSCSVMSNFLQSVNCSLPGSSAHGILQARITGVGCHFFPQGAFPNQGLNPGLPHCRQILYCLSHHESPREVREEIDEKNVLIFATYSKITWNFSQYLSSLPTTDSLFWLWPVYLFHFLLCIPGKFSALCIAIFCS